MFKDYLKNRKLKLQIERDKLKLERMKIKKQFFEKKPTAIDKLINQKEQMAQLTDTFGQDESAKWLKLLDNPLIQQLILSFLAKNNINLTKNELNPEKLIEIAENNPKLAQKFLKKVNK